MSTAEPVFHSDQNELEELPNYRPLSVAAVVGLVLGLLSLVALLHPVLWLLPPLAVVVNLYALSGIDQSGTRTGRGLAVAGLAVALLAGAAAPARVYSYEYLQRRDARQIAEQWFDSLRNGQPQVAHQLTLSPDVRAHGDQEIWSLYQQSESQRKNLRDYVASPVVRTLLELGPKAQVRYYDNEMAQTDGRIDLVKDVYAVTYEDQGKPKSFFIQMELMRALKPETGPVEWRVSSHDGGYRPLTWPKSS
jgi:hypothetical protein